MEYNFEVQDMLPIGLTIVVLGIALGYGLNVTEDVQDDVGTLSCGARTDDYTTYLPASNVCANASNTSQHHAVGTSSFNGSSDAIEGVAKLPEKLPLIVTVIVAALIIGILVRYLMVKYN